MSTAALIDTLTKQGIELKAEGDKLLFRPSERVPEESRAELRKRKSEVVALLIESEALAGAYRRYWTLPETEPMEVFQAAHKEIVRLEAQAEPQTAWRTLRATATIFHAESGICPFCREHGALHFPAERLELELRATVTA